MKLTTVWTSGYPLREKLNRTAEVAWRTAGANVPQRLAYWSLVHQGVRQMKPDEVVPEVPFMDVLQRAGNELRDRRLIHTLLRTPTERGAGRTWGRLTIADARNAAGCPVIDSAAVYVERDNGRLLQVRGVVISPSPKGEPAVAIAWRGSRDAHHWLKRLQRVPGARRLVLGRGHLA